MTATLLDYFIFPLCSSPITYSTRVRSSSDQPDGRKPRFPESSQPSLPSCPIPVDSPIFRASPFAIALSLSLCAHRRYPIPPPSRPSTGGRRSSPPVSWGATGPLIDRALCVRLALPTLPVLLKRDQKGYARKIRGYPTAVFRLSEQSTLDVT